MSAYVIAEDLVQSDIGNEATFTYHGKYRRGKIESVDANTFTLEFSDKVYTAYERFRFDKVQGQVHLTH